MQTREWIVVDLTDEKNTPLAIPVGEPMRQHETVRDGRRVDFQSAHIVHEGEEGGYNNNDNDNDSSKEGPKFISHSVLPTDTLQGICLKYSTTPTQLRQCNMFSGSNLASAPSTLIIQDKMGKGLAAQPQILTPEQKKQKLVQIFLNTFKKKRDEDTGMMVFGKKEAMAYLEMSDWNVDDAIQDAREDYGWEKGDSYSETTSLL